MRQLLYFFQFLVIFFSFSTWNFGESFFHHAGFMPNRGLSPERSLKVQSNKLNSKVRFLQIKFMQYLRYMSSDDDTNLDEEDDHDHDHVGVDLTDEAFQQQTLSYLQEQFQLLSQDKKTINFDILCSWDDIQHLFHEEVLSKKELKRIYLQYCNNLFPNLNNDEGINFEKFVHINYDIDRLIDYEEEILLLEKDFNTSTSSLTSSGSSSAYSLKHDPNDLKALEEALRKELGFQDASEAFHNERRENDDDNSSSSSSSNDDGIALIPTGLPSQDDSNNLLDQELTNEDYTRIMNKILQKNFPKEPLSEENGQSYSTADEEGSTFPMNDMIPDNLPLSNRKYGDDDYIEDYSDEAEDTNILSNEQFYSSISEPAPFLPLQEETDPIYTGSSSTFNTPKKGKGFSDSVLEEALDESHENGDSVGEEEEEENELSGMDIKDVDVWDTQIRSEDLFQKEFLRYLTEFFQQKSQLLPDIDFDEPLLSFKDFFEWEDIQGLITENNIEMIVLKNVWIEATEFERFRYGYEKLNLTSPSFSSKRSSLSGAGKYSSLPLDEATSESDKNPSKDENDKELAASNYDDSEGTSELDTTKSKNRRKKNEKTLLLINLDTFIRLNYRLEQIVEDIQQVYEKILNNEENKKYNTAFYTLTSEHQIYQNMNFNHIFEPIITYEEILNWDYIKQLVKEEKIDIQEIQALYSIFPLDKQILTIPAGLSRSANEVEKKKKKDFLPKEFQDWPTLSKKIDLKEIEGINREKFLFFCSKLQEKLEGKEKRQMKQNEKLEERLNHTAEGEDQALLSTKDKDSKDIEYTTIPREADREVIFKGDSDDDSILG
eukprot:gene9734-10574_t